MALLVRLATSDDVAAGELWAAGAVAVVEEAGTLSAGFADDRTTTRAAEALADRYDVELVFASEELDRSWIADLEPVHTRRLSIRTPAAAPTAGRDEIVIDPGAAFGHGGHPSTSLVLDVVDRRTRPGDHMLDFGTGTGVVAIAALKLGAERALAIDIDPAALELARRNAERNDVANRLELGGRLGTARSFDLVCANITIDVHEDVGPELSSRLGPGGVLVASGLLAPQADRARSAYGDLDELARLRQGDWVALELSRGPGR